MAALIYLDEMTPTDTIQLLRDSKPVNTLGSFMKQLHEEDLIEIASLS